MASSVLARMAVYLTANTAQFGQQLAVANKQSLAFQNTILGVGKALGITFAASQVFDGLKYGVSVMAEFEKQMSTVKAITGATGADLQKLEQNALDLGRSTQFAASKVAGLQIELGRLGFSNKEILKSTEATINLATATGEDLSRSAEIAGSTLRAFQLDASNMGRVTDVMAAAFNNSALALDSFADGVKYVAPVAKATNVSLEETSALLSVLADAGIKGSQAGTSLRRIFTLLTKDGRPFADRLQELADKGITLADANDEMGLYAQTALLIIAAQNEKVKELTETYKNASGEARRTADVMRDNLAGDLTKLGATVDALILKMKDGLLPVMRSIAQSGTSFLTSLTFDDKAIALDNLIQKLRVIDLLNNPHYSEGKKIAAFQQMEKEAEAAGVKLQDLMADYNLVKTTLFGGGNFNPPNPEKFVLGPPQDPSKKQKAPDRTIKFLEDQVKSLEDKIKGTTSSGAILEYQRQIDGLKTEIEKLTGAYSEFERIRRISILSRAQEKQKPTGTGIISDGLKSELDKSAADIATKAYNSMGDALESLGKKYDAAKAKDKEFNEALQSNVATTLQAFDSIGNSITQAIQTGDSWQEAFARVASSIIDNLEAIALSWVVANAAKLGNPLLIGAAIVVGSAIVKGAFGSIYKNNRSSSNGSGATIRQADQTSRDLNITINGELTASGNGLRLALEKGNYQIKRVGG